MDRLFYLIPIVLVIVLLFGGISKLPALGAASGRAIREFRSAVSGQDPGAPGTTAPPASQPAGWSQAGQWSMPGDRPAATVPDDTLRP
ncbi:MAG: twin-arginine translocase TatA/TatE family subunit [Candidatus Dormibacteria bacterium]|jgi:TatA/E family protein of Tat protein translocase